MSARRVSTSGFGAMVITASSMLVAGPDQEGIEAVRRAITTSSPQLSVGHLEATPAPGIFRAEIGGKSVYVTADGRFALSGDLYELTSRTNLSEEARKRGRLDELAEVPPQDVVIFAPPEPRYWITVFTDVDCPFCRKLHGDIDQLVAQGVGVRYLAYPRAGAGSESWTKMEAVWCAAERGAALSKAKRGENVPRAEGCEAAAVARQYLLGERFGIEGTPTLVLQDGSMVSGYIEPAKLLAGLEEIKNKGVAH